MSEIHTGFSEVDAIINKYIIADVLKSVTPHEMFDNVMYGHQYIVQKEYTEETLKRLEEETFYCGRYTMLPDRVFVMVFRQGGYEDGPSSDDVVFTIATVVSHNGQEFKVKFDENPKFYIWEGTYDSYDDGHRDNIDQIREVTLGYRSVGYFC